MDGPRSCKLDEGSRQSRPSIYLLCARARAAPAIPKPPSLSHTHTPRSDGVIAGAVLPLNPARRSVVSLVPACSRRQCRGTAKYLHLSSDVPLLNRHLPHGQAKPTCNIDARRLWYR